MFDENNEKRDFAERETDYTEPVSAPPSSTDSDITSDTAENTENQNGFEPQMSSDYNQTPPPPYAPFSPQNGDYSAQSGYSQPTQNTAPTYQNAPFTPQTSWNKVNYSAVSPIEDYRPASRGLKIFALVMAAVIVLSATCVSGYFLGRSSVSTHNKNSVSLNLAAKPKNTDQMTPAEVYEQVKKSIVGIRVYNSQGKMADASGVIYSTDGYIITNDHIYSEVGAPQFKIYMYDGTEREATYVAGDTVSDLAVLKLKDNSDIESAVLGDSSELFCGENVVAIGRPSDATSDSSITSGIISLTSRRVQTTSSYSARLIQTDSAINPGSSGGALVNMYGQIVGITASKLAGVQYDAVGFAIPTKTVKRVVEQLISDGKVTDRAKLGITYTELNSVRAEISKLDNVGLYVATVSEDSDLYGKVNEGDIITHINGLAISDDNLVLDIIEDCVAGDSISLTVVNSRGNVTDYNVTLKANIGESSYSEVLNSDSSNSGSSESSDNETFDFPFGE